MRRDDVMDTANVYSYGINLNKMKLDLPKPEKTCRSWKHLPYTEWLITKKLQAFVQNTR